MKPDEDRYLRAALQEYDNIAKLGQIIREGPIKVSAPYRLLHPCPGALAKLGPAPEDAGSGNSFLHLQAQLDQPPLGQEHQGNKRVQGTGAHQELLQPMVPLGPGCHPELSGCAPDPLR